MAQEIERKFLVVGDAWQQQVVSSTRIVQGYLAQTDVLTLRVRIRDDAAYLTIKGRSSGVARSEYEYPIPVADAEGLLAEMAQGPVIEKVRHVIPVDAHTWELDVFHGDNEGLVMAEVELSDAQESFTMPSWAGLEVSDDPRYYNASLSRNPFRQWG